MDEKAYFRALSAMSGSRLNTITRAVNNKIPKEEVGLKNEAEEMYFDRLMKDAIATEKKYGEWPVYEMAEIESDDPVLDIYSKPVGE